jgi:CHASE2 domain-containing sensor protein
MSKLVVLNLGRGTLEAGFPFVTVQLQSSDSKEWRQFEGSLSPASNIISIYRRWQLLYDLLYEARSINIGLRLRQLTPPDDGLEVDESDVTHISDADFDAVCKELQRNIDNWLDCKGFRAIESQLRTYLSRSDEVRFIIQTEDYYLRKLPWHIWNFFNDYPLAEIALSPIEFQQEITVSSSTDRIRILAILGDSHGINIDADKEYLSNLPNHPLIVFLDQPSRQKLDEHLWDKRGWDILFFAGHSLTNEHGEGYIYINSTQITIPQLKNSLKIAIERGLKLAIFNSCDGLGLASQLDDLHIPQMIVMREPVPDEIAQEFLKRFLREFAQGQSFYLSVRYAREQLQGLESDFPGASWLPVICQNPAYAPLTWEQMLNNYAPDETLSSTDKNQFAPRNRRPHKHNLKYAMLVVSLVLTILICSGRHSGIFQGWELKAYDAMLRLRPDAGIDSRLLIVEVTDKDLQYQNQLGYERQGSLSDAALTQVLNRLEPLQPSVIGLDNYHDFPIKESQAALAQKLANNQNFFTICKHSDPAIQHPGIAPLDPVPSERLGFSDVVIDNTDGVLRRNVFQMTPNLNSPCPTETSFSFQLALHFLHQNGQPVVPTVKDNQVWLGNQLMPIITSHWGGYQGLEDTGYQIMLNYRSRTIAKKVTLTQVLQNQFDPNLVKNKIVIIGTSTPSYTDELYTPYSLNKQLDQTMRGVLVQAQMVSQIISSVLDQRAFIQIWPTWMETIWIWSWSLVGSWIALYYNKPSLVLILIVGSILLISLICYSILVIQSIWIPFIPAGLAIAFAAVVVAAYQKM